VTSLSLPSPGLITSTSTPIVVAQQTDKNEEISQIEQRSMLKRQRKQAQSAKTEQEVYSHPTWVRSIIIHCVPKNWTTKLMVVTREGLILTDSFTVRLSHKFATKVIAKNPTTP